MKAPSCSVAIGVVLLLVGVACGSSATDGVPSAAPRATEPESELVPLESQLVPDLEEPIDPTPCFAPVRDDLGRYGGAFELANLPRLEPHVDIVELIMVGTVTRRELVVEQPRWFSDNISLGQEMTGGPLPILNCRARYTVQVSDMLKGAGGGHAPAQVTVQMLEREAHFQDGVVLELLPPLSPGDQVVLFLFRGGPAAATYSIFGPRFIVRQGFVAPAGDYLGYADEFDGAIVDDLLSRIRAQVAQVPEVRPFQEVTQEVFEELFDQALSPQRPKHDGPP